ncbi:MAG: FMN-binding protein [Candidatus Uhrbacteria bacterium]|nr:FMN-binding protein [Candidatus Uhrbacteria bacterium]
MEPQKNPAQKWLILVVIIAVLGGLVAFMMSARSGLDDQPPQIPATTTPTMQIPAPAPEQTTTSSPTQTPTPAPTPDATATPPVTQKSTYKDGSYSANGNYVAPGGPETIGISLTLKNDVITAISATPQARNGTSKNWQNYFSTQVSAVVGMKIDSVQVDTVSGSSLTPIGFMDALAKIKAQAQR